MGSFTSIPVSDGSGVDPADFNANMALLETAINALSESQIPADEIPVAKLSEKYAVFALEMEVESVVTGAVIGTIQDNVPMPFGDANTYCVKAAVVCKSGGAAARPTVDIYKKSSGVSILAAPITLALDDTYYSLVPTVQTMLTGDHYTMRVTVPGAGPLVKCKVVLWCKTLLKS